MRKKAVLVLVVLVAILTAMGMTTGAAEASEDKRPKLWPKTDGFDCALVFAAIQNDREEETFSFTGEIRVNGEVVSSPKGEVGPGEWARVEYSVPANFVGTVDVKIEIVGQDSHSRSGDLSCAQAAPPDEGEEKPPAKPPVDHTPAPIPLPAAPAEEEAQYAPQWADCDAKPEDVEDWQLEDWIFRCQSSTPTPPQPPIKWLQGAGEGPLAEPTGLIEIPSVGGVQIDFRMDIVQAEINGDNAVTQNIGQSACLADDCGVHQNAAPAIRAALSIGDLVVVNGERFRVLEIVPNASDEEVSEYTAIYRTLITCDIDELKHWDGARIFLLVPEGEFFNAVA